MSGAREEVLARVREELGRERAQVEVPSSYRQRDESPHAEIVERFAERVADYRADVRRARQGDLPSVLAAACRERGAARVGLPLELPAEWPPTASSWSRTEGSRPTSSTGSKGRSPAARCTARVRSTW
jgi:L-lactate dehydrogenase complex protein LldG